MISEPFILGNSVVHRLDPRIRVVFASAFSFVAALSRHFPVLLCALAVSVVLIFISRLDWWQIGKRIAIVNSLIFLLWLIVPWTFEGEILFQMGPLSITRPGVILSAQITLKSNAILLAFIALVATISFSTLGNALHRLRVPDKIVQLLLMTYRYVFVIEQEYDRLIRAAKIRGFQPGTNLNTYRTYAYVVGMLFIRAAARADRVYQAMLCRGFKGKFYSLQTFQMNTESWIFSTTMTAIIFGLIVLEMHNTNW